MIKNKSKYLCIFMSAFLLLSGCGQAGTKTPELLEPISGNEAYRAIEKGTVGNYNVLFGVVVPTEEPHFYEKSVTIKEIYVDVGDYVEAGQKLAQANISELEEYIAANNRQIKFLQDENNLNENLYSAQRQELLYKLADLELSGDVEDINSTKLEISTLDENHSFDNKMYELQVRMLNTENSENSKIVENSILYARESGYVSYIKDIAGTGIAGANENIVSVADYDDAYVETMISHDDVNVKTDDNIVAKTGIEENELYVYEYNNTEKLLASNRDLFLPLRLRFKDAGKTPSLGSQVPIFVKRNVLEDVLVVGVDSVYEDNKGTFVYVKGEDGRQTRYVTLGKNDGINYEVVDGLSEGEYVYYSSKSVIPEKYDEEEVGYGRFAITVNTEGYSTQDYRNKLYFFEDEGQINEVFVAEGDEVNAGDRLCSVQTNEGSARLTEISNEIDNIKRGYNNEITALDQEIAETNKKIQGIAVLPATPTYEIATGTDAEAEESEEPEEREPSRDELLSRLQQLSIKKEMATLTYNNDIESATEEYERVGKNNNGNGIVTIYAKESGVVNTIYAKAGNTAKEGGNLCILGTPTSVKIGLIRNEVFSVAQEVVFTDKETGKAYTGKIVGSNGYKYDGIQKGIVATIDGISYVSTCAINSNSTMYYVKMDDESFYYSDASCVASVSTNSMENAITVPKKAIYSETDKRTRKVFYYVWRVVDGQLSKTYVTVSELEADGRVFIISGLKKDDIIAVENKE